MERASTVVFLHGLGRTSRSLRGLRRHVEAAGFRTWARTYPSRRRPVPDLARQVHDWIRADLGEGPLHAVTHSLGGILARHIGPDLPWERVVMLAPPNRGSRVAAALRYHPLFRWFYGPAGQDVAGESHDWPDPRAHVGVIAGTRGASLSNPPSLLTRALALLPEGEPHDGTVTVSETRLAAMSDFATVEASHTWIMNHPRTRQLVVRFLRHGSFTSRGGEGGGAQHR